MFWHQKWSLSYMFVMTESSSHLFHIMWPWNLKDPTATVKKMVQKKKVTFDSVFLLKLSLWMIETITKRKRGEKKGKGKMPLQIVYQIVGPPGCGKSIWV